MPRTCSNVPQPDLTRTAEHPAPMVRPAEIHDVPEIHHLLEIYSAQGNLLPRTMNELDRHLRDFFVVEVSGKLAACGALEIFTESLGEVRSLVVDDAFKGRGFGRMLVQRIADEARGRGLPRLRGARSVAAPFCHM